MSYLLRIQKPAELSAIAAARHETLEPSGYGYPAIYDPATAPNNNHYSERHSEGLNIGWCDGHVKWVKRAQLFANPQWCYR